MKKKIKYPNENYDSLSYIDKRLKTAHIMLISIFLYYIPFIGLYTVHNFLTKRYIISSWGTVGYTPNNSSLAFGRTLAGIVWYFGGLFDTICAYIHLIMK